MIETARAIGLTSAPIGNETRRRGPKLVTPEQANAQRLIHDLNNALTVVLSAANMLQGELPANSTLADDVNDVYTHARSAVAIAQSLSQALRKFDR
jgi:predicted component of type VI protein secretion system